MSMKRIFETQVRQQKMEIARQALKQSFRGSIADRTSMGEVLDELEDDEHLWKAFRSLRFGEMREMLNPDVGGATPPGPSRKRGVTSRRIIEFVGQNPGVRRAQIMKALGLKGGTVSSQLRALRAAGKLRSEGTERKLQYYPS